MKTIFLDRDGTINVDTGYTHDVSDFAFETNVIPGLELLRDAGFVFFIVTNQSGIAKGYYAEEDFYRFNNHAESRLALHGIDIRKTYFCPDHPTEGIGRYRQDSPLRKPRPGMLEQAANEFPINKETSWMIGDKWADVAAGHAFGIRSVLLRSGKGGSDLNHRTAVEYVAQDLLDAAHLIINATTL